jgi:hypothetical protein
MRNKRIDLLTRHGLTLFDTVGGQAQPAQNPSPRPRPTTESMRSSSRLASEASVD